MTDPSRGPGGRTTVPNQVEKAAVFQALHGRPSAFVSPNRWDAGTARILMTFGFEAAATTSAGLNFALGQVLVHGAEHGHNRFIRRPSSAHPIQR